MKSTLVPLLFLSTLNGQVTIGESRIEMPVFHGDSNGEAQQAQIQAAAANPSSNQKEPEAFRKEILGKLKFDRSPSGILQEESLSRHPEDSPPKAAPPSEAPDEQKLLREKYQQEAQEYRRNVVLGNWDEVRSYLENLPEDLGAATYLRLLQELGKPVPVILRPEAMAMGARPHNQANYFSTADILALADVPPKAPDKQAIQALAKLLPEDPPTNFLATLAKGTRYFGNDDPSAQLRTSELLLEGGLTEAASDFLPDLDTARSFEQTKALNILSRYHAEAHRQALGSSHLPLAWELSLEVMSLKKAEMPERLEALYRALSLVPELDEGTGQNWLKETFSDPAGEGFEILAAAGTLGSQSQQIRDASIRQQQIQLQKSAAEALLGTKGIDLSEWEEIFSIYALNWLQEAKVTLQFDRSTSSRPEMQVDNYGNVFYGPRNYYANNDRKGPNPIPTGDLLELVPSEKWIAAVDETVAQQLLEQIPRLYLKVKEHQKAFPLIEKLAESRPKTAKELVRNLISVWAENHNPNLNNRYRSRYSYFYGYNNHAETIPLTRSKQERNLKELAGLVTEVRELELDEAFDEEFANAFITVHSQAEVWRLEALQKVFGELEALDSEVIASLIERMRINLAALWPNPKVQEAAGTKRRDKELHQQVLDGYEMAREVTAKAWGNDIGSSQLLTQLAAIVYEESNYLSNLQPQATHSSTKRTALDDFAEAARLYAATLPMEDKSEENTAVYETWFYAALGSPLLEALKAHHMPVQSEFVKIKGALDSLPEPIRERHYAMLATTLNNRLANVAPDLKFRYLQAAIDVVGRHEKIGSAAEVYDYYKDLVTEIELIATLDGPAEVGTEPFGLFVNLHHTKEIERESGGFQRYLQNQNNVSYSYNFGRPTEDYRDKFEKAARTALEENFEVVSLTFHTDKIDSRTSSRLGWRTTPYAYFLLKAKGPQIDNIPPLKIDLDFLDTSGHVVLPVSSANVPLVATADSTARPVRDLKVTMTLDERNAEEKGEWNLEVKTAGKGLVASLQELVDLPPKGFEVVATEDRELQVEELTTDTDDGAPLSTHEYRLTLKPEGDSPKQFAFPTLTAFAMKSLAEENGVLRQRYQDVDLIPVDELVELEESSSSPLWYWLSAVILALIAFFGWKWSRKSEQSPGSDVEGGPALPSTLTAVSLLHWLKNLKGHVPAEQAKDLSSEIQQLERHAFSAGGKELNLEEIARHWKSFCSKNPQEPTKRPA
ncbi:hypothetical protein [Roseibacillus persicicus]|uniref:Uncharacterized protein n=1 Tax=Roseibacillus persicicus TaxID=454148 RepID=A0A918TPP7_9BACT|nr:hypothetical protein [Roseibacillus persicicus]GHC51329.1 hypothetical protein GCM10007100_16910 [Roseibacillus persicicus]